MAYALVFLVCVCAVVQNGFAQVGSICRPFERLLPCGGCQKTCDDPEPESCTAECRVGCYCPEGQVRNAKWECVNLEDCPSNVQIIFKHDTTEPRPDYDCPENEEYRFCENCNRTCDNPRPRCPAECAKGCFCKGEMMRDTDGKCKEYQECLKVKNHYYNYVDPIPYRVVCGPFQRYKKCDCERTCANPTPSCPQDSCTKGCFCDPGYVKFERQCIKLDECPKAYLDLRETPSVTRPQWITVALSNEFAVNEGHELSVEDCGPDEEYLSCGWCEPSCSEPTPQCPIAVCTRGCLCRPPLLRHHSGRCVQAKDCSPQKCPDPHEEYVCRYGCEARCDRGVCLSRPRRCQLGCHCRLGLLRDVTGRCVPPSNCTVGRYFQRLDARTRRRSRDFYNVGFFNYK